MKHSTKLLTPAEALYRTFRPQNTAYRQQCRSYQPVLYNPPNFDSPPRRGPPYGAPPNLRRPPASDSRQAQLLPELARKLSAFTINRAIPTRWVQLRSEDGKLAAPQMLDTVLSTLDHDRKVIRMLNAEGPTPNTAIAEVADIEVLVKMAAERQQAAKELEKQKKSVKAKQIELNWAISGNDLGLKLKQLGEFLDKGKKVEVLMANKKRQRKATREEATEMMNRLRARIEELGAREVKLEGQLMGQATMVVEKKKT